MFLTWCKQVVAREMGSYGIEQCFLNFSMPINHLRTLQWSSENADSDSVGLGCDMNSLFNTSSQMMLMLLLLPTLLSIKDRTW